MQQLNRECEKKDALLAGKDCESARLRALVNKGREDLVEAQADADWHRKRAREATKDIAWFFANATAAQRKSFRNLSKMKPRRITVNAE